MPFNSNAEMEARLRNNPDKLSPHEVRDLIPWMHEISEVGMRRLNVELSLQNLQAVQQFERSSTKLTYWLIGLTVALVLLTTALLCHG